MRSTVDTTTINNYLNTYRIDDEAQNQLDIIIASMIAQYHLQVTQEFLLRKVNQMFDMVNTFNDEQMIASVKSALGVDIFISQPELLQLKDMWVANNVKLITSVETQFYDRIANIISTAVRNGALNSDVTKQIQYQTGASQKRSAVIARDQVGTLNGQLTKQRQTRLGIKQYIWRTSEDRRVRPLHKPRDGETFSWDNPPSDGHPGMPIQCRCVALPIIDTDKL